MNPLRRGGRTVPQALAVWAALGLSLCVGVLGRGYWTPDEPREADIAWRMSWQSGKAVPLLAGDAFCEKPPFTYWVAGAAIDALGTDAWVARLPNLLYAIITALAVGALARRSVGPLAGLVAAAAISTFLLSYQVAIWLATDAPLLAAVAVALLGLYIGFHARLSGERLRGYTCMHAALAVGFMSKSAAAWMVPALTLALLVIWERRWRELLRWELYLGLAIQAAVILTWVWCVYSGPEGAAHLKVFFWNNLVGRFAQVDAPQALQYAGAHRNFPGKYLIELPVYLWPWTLLVAAAARAAWRQRHAPPDAGRSVRFALATFLPTLGVLSVAATARNIYLAPALPGAALLLGWWAHRLAAAQDRWDRRALEATAALLLLATLVLLLAAAAVAPEAAETHGVYAHGVSAHGGLAVYAAVCIAGLLVSSVCSLSAWRAARRGLLRWSLFGLLLAYCALLVGPASQIYRRVDAWQNLGVIGRAIAVDSVGRPLILFAPDETTRALVDLYVRTSVEFLPGPITAFSTAGLRDRLALAPSSLVLTQLPGRGDSRALRELAERLGLGRALRATPAPSAEPPPWAASAGLTIAQVHALPNGRRYALLELGSASASR